MDVAVVVVGRLFQSVTRLLVSDLEHEQRSAFEGFAYRIEIREGRMRLSPPFEQCVCRCCVVVRVPLWVHGIFPLCVCAAREHNGDYQATKDDTD